MSYILITSTAIEKDNKFLILKRAKHDTKPGMWEFPGGKIEDKESVEDCCKREVFEESGLKTNEIKYIGYSERCSSSSKNLHVIAHHFHCKNFDGDVRLSNEHEDFKWITRKEILSMNMGKDIGTDTIQFFNLKDKSCGQ
jgi:8-oxo-dGTP pyrophosphatase MutT (NUDIX family)